MNLSFTDKQIKALDLKIKLVHDVVKLVDKIKIGQYVAVAQILDINVV